MPSDSLVPANDPSVLFTSAGMNQFKDYFLGRCKDFRRATSSQKCFRTGDLDEVGQTPFHHTFFEMLGNFSFGDYFKEEAILLSWEFMTRVLEIDPARLWASVYEDDVEAFDIWRKRIGLSEEKIKKMGPKDNFWPSNAITDGPNGPCGPCSEIYYTREDATSVEVWNLVFTQFNRCDGGVLEPLPSKNIDTGMGLERMSSVLQGVDTNFKIDIFAPIVEAVQKAVGVDQENRVYTIADHARAVVFCIGDGVLPSNDGRGYVVRKLIRRCQYLAKTHQKAGSFLYKIVSSVAQAMREPYPEILERRDNIAQIIKAEEEKYIKNILEGGTEKLQAVIENLKKAGKDELPAEAGFDLYVTYGIQPEFTKETFERSGIRVDLPKINDHIEREQERSRRASKITSSIFGSTSPPLKSSVFVGYEKDVEFATVLQIIRDGKERDEAGVSEKIGVVLDKTPFYGESGGQVGDQGLISFKDSDFKIRVSDTKKQDGSIIHLCEVLGPVSPHRKALRVGDKVVASVDSAQREAVKRAHTATHILQAVLRKVLGPHVQQAGSFVEPDRFRFDFTHFQEIAREEREGIQAALNEYVMRNDPARATLMPKVEAQRTGAIALFGEKYEDTVRVVSVGGYSKEFCGGTHLDATGKIGFILLVSETSIGSGLRRIEALTGPRAYKQASSLMEILQAACGTLKTQPQQFLGALEGLILKEKVKEKELLKLHEKNIVSEIDDIIKRAKKDKDITRVSHVFKNADIGLLRRAVDLLKNKIPKAGVFVLAGTLDTDVFFVCGLTSDMVQKGLSADLLVKRVLPLIGGSGGGRKDFAQGGSKDVSKIEAALKEFEKAIREAL